MLTKLCERIVSHWTGKKDSFPPPWLIPNICFRKEIKLLLSSQWAPLSLFSLVGLLMHGEGAQKFTNTLGDFRRNSLCHNLLWRVYSLKPLPYTPVTPFPLDSKVSPNIKLGIIFWFPLRWKEFLSPQLWGLTDKGRRRSDCSVTIFIMTGLPLPSEPFFFHMLIGNIFQHFSKPPLSNPSSTWQHAIFLKPAFPLLPAYPHTAPLSPARGCSSLEGSKVCQIKSKAY